MRLTLAILFSLLLVTSAYAAPTISGTPTATLNTITVGGLNFGDHSGPTIVVFDDFESGTDQTTISLTGPPVGAWTSLNAYDPYYDDLSWSTGSAPHGDFSMQTGNISYTSSTEVYRQVKVSFTESEGIFVSYYFMIPDGSTFPNYIDPITEEEFPAHSVWKMSWLYGDGGNGQTDTCFPTKSSDSYFTMSGNSQLPALSSPLGNEILNLQTGTPSAGVLPGWMQWDKWSRATLWMLPNASTPYGWTGDLQIQMLAEGKGSYEYNHTNVRTLIDEGWTSANFPGWMRIPADATESVKVKPVYDDIYVATGPNAAARVEIGNSATYSSCTKLAIQTVDTWSDTEVVADLRLGGFDAGDTAYVFVVDADNDPSTGIAITIPQSHPLYTDGTNLLQ